MNTEQETKLEIQAQGNLFRLKTNTYPGRLIITGMSEDGKKFYQGYAIMGRSENSRNRIFVAEGGTVKTEAYDKAKVTDPSLIIYTAMTESLGIFVVTNGHQTDDAWENTYSSTGLTSDNFLKNWQYEPDEPNFTPRISSVLSFTQTGGYKAEFSILKHSRFGGSTDVHTHCYKEFLPGYGLFISTYQGDGNPLPAFEGEPRVIPLKGDPQQVLETIWNHLAEENKVSLALKIINSDDFRSTVRIINKHEKVPA